MSRAGLVLESASVFFPRTDICRTSLLIALVPLGLFFTPVGGIIAARASNTMLTVIVMVWLAACVLGMWFCWGSGRMDTPVRARITYYHQVGYYALRVRGVSDTQRLAVLPYVRVLAGGSA